MEVEFKKAVWSKLWIYLEFTTAPNEAEQQYIQQLFESWYTLGLLGGFNATATPIQNSEVEDLSHLEYPAHQERLPSLMHNMGEVEFQQHWARCWFDLGTADALALDILINALDTLSHEYASLKRVIVGGNPETARDGYGN
ncbi:DUF3531 family protein [Anthocerotibacter panamensis]|uniref:DUF3531 family protein n=1 Tax=Anthocerotibacter panamensis TaxID=2857077 RepID=UPI001C402D0D|nr:DUF3531 family protein [Anthocerotibacter panamensis]